MNIDFDFEPFPNLDTPRLALRAMRSEDANAIFALFSDSDVMKYYDKEPFTSLQEAEVYIERQRLRFEQKESFRWGIALKESDSIIGTCGYVAWHKPWGIAEIGYDLARAYWRQGYMTEALSAMLQFGFAHMGLHRIEAEVMPGNVNSLRLLEKLHFHAEGTLRQRGFWKGQFHDLMMLALLKNGE